MRPDRRQGAAELSELEVLVLRMYSHGLTTAMVAEDMHYSVTYVRHLSASARRKLAAKNTAQAVGEALRLGLFP